MKTTLFNDNWEPELINNTDNLFAAIFKQGSFDYGYVEAFDTDDVKVKEAFNNLVTQFTETGCEEDTEICIIKVPNTQQTQDLCKKAFFNGNNQSISSIEALSDLYNNAECEIIECWESNTLTESKRRKKSKKKKIGGYITYTTGDPDLNIKHFNKSMGTFGLGDADRWTNIVGDTLPDGPVSSEGADVGEGTGDGASGEGGMGENLEEASNLTPFEKMRDFDAGKRRENIKACSDQKLQMYYNICKANGFSNALAKITAELNNRGFNISTDAKLKVSLRDVLMFENDVQPADALFVKTYQNEPSIIEAQANFAPTASMNRIMDNIKCLILYTIYAMLLQNQALADRIKDFIIKHYTISVDELKQFIKNRIIGDPKIMERISDAINFVKEQKTEALTEAKRYVKRYYIRPQNIFCSNKEDILLALLRVGDANCSVYSLKGLKDHDDVHLLKPSDIIYYYDDGILYDKNHVKVMDYDLFVKHEENRKKFNDIDKAPEAAINKVYDDRLTKDDLNDKEAVANFKAINEKYSKASLKEALDTGNTVNVGINSTDFNKNQSLFLDCVGTAFDASKLKDKYIIKSYLIKDDGKAEQCKDYCKICDSYEDFINEINKLPLDICCLDLTDELTDDAFNLEFEDRNVFGESLEDEETFTCCICGEESHGYGNNPEPIKHEGKCCDSCNAKFVIPARLEQLSKKEHEE